MGRTHLYQNNLPCSDHVLDSTYLVLGKVKEISMLTSILSKYLVDEGIVELHVIHGSIWRNGRHNSIRELNSTQCSSRETIKIGVDNLVAIWKHIHK